MTTSMMPGTDQNMSTKVTTDKMSLYNIINTMYKYLNVHLSGMFEPCDQPKSFNEKR